MAQIGNMSVDTAKVGSNAANAINTAFNGFTQNLNNPRFAKDFVNQNESTVYSEDVDYSDAAVEALNQATNEGQSTSSPNIDYNPVSTPVSMNDYYKHLFTDASTSEKEYFFKNADYKTILEAEDYLNSSEFTDEERQKIWNDLGANSPEVLKTIDSSYNLEQFTIAGEKAPQKDDTDYFSYKNHEMWKIDNIPCNETERKILENLQTQYNENTAKSEFYERVATELRNADGSYLGPGLNNVTPGVGSNIVVNGNAVTTTSSTTYWNDVENIKNLKSSSLSAAQKNWRDYVSISKLIYKTDYENKVKSKDDWDDFRKVPLDWRKVVVEWYKPEHETSLDDTELSYMSEDEIYILGYLRTHVGDEDANRYISLFHEGMNYEKAKKVVDERIKTLQKIDPNNIDALSDWLVAYGYISAEGLKDGLDTFLEGFVTASTYGLGTDMSQNDYEKYLILEYLAENYPELEKTYSISEKIGESAIPVIAAVAVTAGTGGNKDLGTLAMTMLRGLKKYMLAQKANLQNGYDGATSTLDAAAEGLTQFVIERLVYFALTRIPTNVSSVITDEIRSLFSKIAGKVASAEVTAFAEKALTGKKVNTKGLSNELFDIVCHSIILSMLTNSTSSVIKIFKEDKEIIINYREIEQAVLGYDSSYGDFSKYVLKKALELAGEGDETLDDMVAIMCAAI